MKRSQPHRAQAMLALWIVLPLAALGGLIHSGCSASRQSIQDEPRTAGETALDRPTPPDDGGVHELPGADDSEPVEPTARLFPTRTIPTPCRAVWVARFHYQNERDVRKIIADCAAAGFNTILWQVRGCADVLYPSKLEPWSEELMRGDPGFDPLALAVSEAHRLGLRLEAWFNVMPGWRGKRPPTDRTHVYYTHPEWFLADAGGKRQPLSDFYVILNPCLPEVREHIAAVAGEIARNYAIDGLHLDYVRYAWDDTKDARKRFPRDPRTLALFRAATNHAPDDDPALWEHWRADQLTELVHQIRAAVDAQRPNATLTAAVWNSPSVGRREYLQSAVLWLNQGVLDAVMPMAYTEKLDQFDRFIGEYHAYAQGRVIPGVGAYRCSQPGELRAELDRCRQWGGDFALFSYESLFPIWNTGRGEKKAEAKAAQLRDMRRQVLLDRTRIQ